MFEVYSPEKWEKDWSQQEAHVQVANWTGSGVRRSESPLSAYHTRRKRSMKSSYNSVKVRVW